jgi:indolepyruvate ferredoxin oxidoreductase alpha subunit
MAERSFKAEVEHLRLGAGETFTGEGILAITKALLESGVGRIDPALLADPEVALKDLI